MGLGDRLKAMAELGSGELRGAYLDRKREIERKAEHRRLLAKNEIERARAKAVKAKEMADLETAMYQAKLAAKQAQAQAKSARHAAGEYTTGEHLGRLARGGYGVGRSFVRDLMTPDRPKRTARRSMTTKRPAAGKRKR